MADVDTTLFRPGERVPDRERGAPPAPRRVRLAALIALVGIAFWLGHVGGGHILHHTPDFLYFYNAGASLLHHGTLDSGYDRDTGGRQPRGTLDWYWPFVHRLMTLLAWMPYDVAGHVWLFCNLVVMFATLRLLGRHLSGLPPQDWPVTQLVPFVLLSAYWLWEYRLNQVNNLTLLLMLGSFTCWRSGRRGVAGLWLGLAVLLKITPALFVLWFALKREFRTVLVAVATIVLAGPMADAITFGPTYTRDAYEVWARKAVATGSQRGLIMTQSETDWRNQGLPAVASRWLSPANYNTHFDNDPAIQQNYKNYPILTMNVATLPRETVARIVTIITLATLAGLAWLGRRPASALTPWQLRLEWTLCLLAMLWLMPVMRRYHLIWLLPALTVLGGALHHAGLRAVWSRVALASIALAVGVQFTMFTPRAEATGALLASVLGLAVPIVWMLMRLGRTPDLLRELPKPTPAACPAPGTEGAT